MASCLSGTLQLHALKGISSWSKDDRTGSVIEAVGNALGKPALKLKTLVRSVKAQNQELWVLVRILVKRHCLM